MIGSFDLPKGLRRLIALILCTILAFSLTNIYLGMHPQLNLQWMEPWSVQAVTKGDELFVFIEVHRMVRRRGLLISASTMSTDWFSHVVRVSCRQELGLC